MTMEMSEDMKLMAYRHNEDISMTKKVKFVNGNMMEYEIMPLVSQYDKILRQPTKEVDFETMPGNEIAYLAMSLMESCNFHDGLGLSANQIGIPYRMCAINMLGQNRIWCMINPKVIDRSETNAKFKEGCLSFPGLFLLIGRPETVTVEFQAVNGEKLVQQFDGLTATCVQHELDHLDGIVYTDLVSKVKLDMAKRKVKTNLKKMCRWAAEQERNSHPPI